MMKRALLLVLTLFTLFPAVSFPAHAQDCRGLLPVPLVVGGRGRVASGQANNLRAAAAVAAERLARLPDGTTFTVLGGPVCADGYVWWEVTTAAGTGWLADGAQTPSRVLWVVPLLTDAPPVGVDNAPDFGLMDTLLCDSPGRSAALALSVTGRYAAYGCDDRSVRIYDLARGSETTRGQWHHSAIYGIHFLPDEQRLLVFGAPSPGVLLLDARSGALLGSHNPPLMSFRTRVNPDASLYVTQESADGAALYGVNTFQRARTLDLPSGASGDLLDFAFAPDGDRVAALLSGGTLVVWETATGRLRQTLTPETPTAGGALTFSPSGRYLVTVVCIESPSSACDPGEIHWWDTRTGERARVWTLPDDVPPDVLTGIGDLAFSPDAALLAVGGCNLLLLYDVQRGELARDWQPGRAARLAWSPDGAFLLTACGGAQVWGAGTAGAFWARGAQ